jgi:hypothetical protein
MGTLELLPCSRAERGAEDALLPAEAATNFLLVGM